MQTDSAPPPGGETGGQPTGTPPATAGATAVPRAGRNLPVAIAVGVGLSSLVLVCVLLAPLLFVALVTVAVAIAIYELSSALTGSGRARLPIVPMIAGGAAIELAAYRYGAGGLVLALLLTVAAAALWLLPSAERGYLHDVTASCFTAVYVPFLAGFSVLLVAQSDGAMRVIGFVLTTVASDTGGYIAGVLKGKHKMAPVVSPKKTWEGFAGSVAGCVLAGLFTLLVLLDGTWWQGVLFGLGVVVSATLGDLGESLIKRDLGIKDMGKLLPAHGGIMDRLDSLLPTAPVAWLLLTAFVPSA